MPKPNVLLILTDDQRFDTIQSWGYPQMITPNLDRLVRNGLSFRQAHIPGGTSGAVCMPSRAMLMTGRTLFHLECEGQSIPSEHVQIGEVFQAQGYQAFGTGKWHNGTASYTRNFTCGDHVFFGGMWDHWNVPTCSYDASGQYDNQVNVISNFYMSNRSESIHCDAIQPGCHSSELLADATLAFLDRQPLDEPFFAYTAFLAPHDPRSMPAEFLGWYDPDLIQLPPNFMAAHPFDMGITGQRDEMLAASPRDPQEVRRHIREYQAMISHLDSQIGRIVDKLDEQGRLDNTILVLAGDNGLAVGQHGLMGKQNLYDHSIRVPLIMSGPGIPRGQVCNSFVYLLDIFPTLCDLCQMPIPDSVEGLSLMPLVKDPTASVRDSVYAAFTDLLRCIRTSRYKLIEACGPARKTLLFDLVADPWEKDNLADYVEYQSVIAQLRQQLLQHRDQWDDRSHRMGRAFWERYDEAY